MSLPVPDWVNNEEMLKNRIMELFGQKKWYYIYNEFIGHCKIV